MLLADVVATSTEVAATRSRKAKVAAIAELLRRVADASRRDRDGDVLPRRRRCGSAAPGWAGASMQSLPAPAAEPSLTVLEVHEAFDRIAALAGRRLAGGAGRGDRAELFGRATADEQPWLRGLVTGEVRQGALDSLVQEGLAAAGGVPLAAVRRAAMMAGSTVAVAAAALTGGEEALGGVRARGRPAGAADAGLQRDRPSRPRWPRPAAATVAVDTKLDGIRIQVHRRGDDVLVATRSLEDITARLPEVVEVARALPADVVRARRRGAGARRRTAGRGRSRRPRRAPR